MTVARQQHMGFTVRRGQVWRPKPGRSGGAFTVRSLDREFAYCTDNRSGHSRRIKLGRFAEDYELVREASGPRPSATSPVPVLRRAAHEPPSCCGYPLAGGRCRVCGEVVDEVSGAGRAEP